MIFFTIKNILIENCFLLLGLPLFFLNFYVFGISNTIVGSFAHSVLYLKFFETAFQTVIVLTISVFYDDNSKFLHLLCRQLCSYGHVYYLLCWRLVI